MVFGGRILFLQALEKAQQLGIHLFLRDQPDGKASFKFKIHLTSG